MSIQLRQGFVGHVVECRIWLAVGLVLLGTSGARARENLLANGSFDDPAGPLKGWRIHYPDNKNYATNHELIEVIPQDGSRRNVLRIHGTRHLLWVLGGVKTDSHPIPYEQGATYKISLYARTKSDTPGKPGPNARVYVEGWKWRPGIRPHENPTWSELRKVYRQQAGRMVYFTGRKEGAFSKPSTAWKRGVCRFPGADLSKTAQRVVKMVQFITLHIVAISNWDGDLLIDDVVVEKVK